MNKAKQFLITHAPNPIPRWLTLQTSRVMVECIRELEVVSGLPIFVEDIEMRCVKLSHGISAISHTANSTEQRVLGFVSQEHGLDASYSKALMDLVARYVYPHVGGAVLKMDYPVTQRSMFHPQQKNFLLEEQKLPVDKRKAIAAHFTPMEGWHCLDIGAFLGHGATWLRERVGATGKIICVEASEHNHAVIQKLNELNGFVNVDSLYAAIWHTEGESISFNMTSRQGNAIDREVVNGNSTETVATTSIPALTEMLGRAADFVSLTVNGAEVEAIEGLLTMSRETLPLRIIAPGWYQKENRPRSDFLEPLFKKLGYQYVMTHGRLMFAWLEN